MASGGIGYSYRSLVACNGNRVPRLAIDAVAAHGFGRFFKNTRQFNGIANGLAHAEPYACNAGTNKHIYTFERNNISGRSSMMYQRNQ